MQWAYGVTTVPNRTDGLLPRTLASLKAGGFDCPWLFVDGSKAQGDIEKEFGLSATTRSPAVRAYGNWLLGLLELAVRFPTAERYAMFQDDLVCSLNLRRYLERCKLAEDQYWNLYTYPSWKGAPGNDGHCQGQTGWRMSNQAGWGGLALVFTRALVTRLLITPQLMQKPFSASTGHGGPHRNIDGAVLEAVKSLGGKELVHCPSLVQHTGGGAGVSEIGKWNKVHAGKDHPLAPSFKGEDFDLMTLLPN